jgi:hypothetical protein
MQYRASKLNSDISNVSDTNDWSSDIETVLEQIRVNSVILSKEHKTKYLYLKGILRYFRVPVILISSIASVSSVGLQSYMDQQLISAITCLLSLTCGIIGSIELFLAIQTSMENELMASKDYYILSIEIFKILTLDRENRSIGGKTFLEASYSTYVKLIENSNIIDNKISDRLAHIDKNSKYIMPLNSRNVDDGDDSGGDGSGGSGDGSGDSGDSGIGIGDGSSDDIEDSRYNIDPKKENSKQSKKLTKITNKSLHNTKNNKNNKSLHDNKNNKNNKNNKFGEENTTKKYNFFDNAFFTKNDNVLKMSSVDDIIGISLQNNSPRIQNNTKANLNNTKINNSPRIQKNLINNIPMTLLQPSKFQRNNVLDTNLLDTNLKHPNTNVLDTNLLDTNLKHPNTNVLDTNLLDTNVLDTNLKHPNTNVDTNLLDTNLNPHLTEEFNVGMESDDLLDLESIYSKK